MNIFGYPHIFIYLTIPNLAEGSFWKTYFSRIFVYNILFHFQIITFDITLNTRNMNTIHWKLCRLFYKLNVICVTSQWARWRPLSPHLHCLLSCLFRLRSKITSKLRLTGFCEGNSPGNGGFPHKGPVTRKCFHSMTSSVSDLWSTSHCSDVWNSFYILQGYHSGKHIDIFALSMICQYWNDALTCSPVLVTQGSRASKDIEFIPGIPEYSCFCNTSVNSSPFSVAYMRQWIGSALDQIMACRLFGANSFSKPMLHYCHLDP